MLVVYETMGEWSRATGGVYVKGGSGSISGRVEAYGQVGGDDNTSIQAGMVGVNVGVPVPRAPFAFGGWNDSQADALASFARQAFDGPDLGRLKDFAT